MAPTQPGLAVAESETAPKAVVSIIRRNGEHPLLEPVEVVAANPEILQGLYDARGRLTMPAPLRGTHEILVHQNQVADQDGLPRVQDDGDLLRMRESKALVALPVSEEMQVDDRLPSDRRFCTPWAARFLLELGRAHYRRFRTPLQVNSAVRTVAFQLRLMRSNGNAAPADGDTASPHLTGEAIDIGKKGLSQAEIAWLRLYLTPMIGDSRIDVEEEFQQACFHISVYKRYAGQVVPEPRIAVTHRTVTPALAAALE